MQTSSLYPLIQVADVDGTARFYETHFGFARTFDLDWYVQLRAQSEHPFEIALIAADHESVPVAYQGVTQKLLLSFYVEDAAVEQERLLAAGVTVVQPLRDEVFGQRHFIAVDPSGNLLDIITPIDPDPAWLAANFPAEQ